MPRPYTFTKAPRVVRIPKEEASAPPKPEVANWRALAETINESIADRGADGKEHHLTLTALNASITCAMRDGTFRRKRFYQGDQFELTSVRARRGGGLVFFLSIVPSADIGGDPGRIDKMLIEGVQHAETSFAEGEQAFGPAFQHQLQEILGMPWATAISMTGVTAAADPRRDLPAREIEQLEDWGSWG